MPTNESVLSDDMLRAFAERAGGYDRENRFFQEDFRRPSAPAISTMAVPKELGGRGMNLAQVAREQRRLAITRQPPRSVSTCTSTGSGWLLISGATASALGGVAAEGGDGGRGVQRRSR
jgi:hypothetical protein